MVGIRIDFIIPDALITLCVPWALRLEKKNQKINPDMVYKTYRSVEENCALKMTMKMNK